MDLVFKSVRERSTARNYCPFCLLSVISNVVFFLISSMILGLFNQLYLYLLAVVSYRIARGFNSSWAFDRLWHAGASIQT